MEVNRNIAATALVSIGNNEQTTSSTLPTTNNTIPDRWSKLSAVYPNIEMIVESLQDPGKSSKSKKNNTIKYSKIESLAKKLHDNIKLHYPNSGLDKNVSRGKAPLVAAILRYQSKFQFSTYVTTKIICSVFCPIFIFCSFRIVL